MYIYSKYKNWYTPSNSIAIETSLYNIQSAILYVKGLSSGLAKH